MTTVRSDARRNRDALLHAAADVLAERGIDAPVTAIAERAGVTKMTLYRHFASKDELIGAVMADHFERLEQLARSTADSGRPPLEALAEYMAAAVTQLAPDRGYFHVAMMAGAASDVVHTAASRAHEAVSVLVDAAQADGSLRAELDAGDIHMLIMGLTHSFAPTAVSETASWRRQLRLLLDGLALGTPAIDEPPLEFADYRRIHRQRRLRQA